VAVSTPSFWDIAVDSILLKNDIPIQEQVVGVFYRDSVNGSLYLSNGTLPEPIAVGPAGTTSVSTVIERRTSDPTVPLVGQMWIRTDL